MNLIVVQGGSATGKTTLSRKLAADLGYYLFNKDTIKELLYDTLGVPAERDESSLYGLAATKALFAMADAFLAAGRDVIIESTFYSQFAVRDIEKLTDNKAVIAHQVYVTASPEVCFQRYSRRIETGERHDGHPDKETTVEGLIKNADNCSKLPIDDTIEVNTDDFKDHDYTMLLRELKKRIGEPAE